MHPLTLTTSEAGYVLERPTLAINKAVDTGLIRANTRRGPGSPAHPGQTGTAFPQTGRRTEQGPHPPLASGNSMRRSAASPTMTINSVSAR